MQPHLDRDQLESFPTDPSGLPEAGPPKMIELADGETLNLVLGPVSKHLNGSVVRMLAYNGSIPGPTLKVRQGSEIIVQVANNGDLDTTVHWHGLRLENRYDGVPHATQAPIPVGEEFSYRVQFPDPGLYWYNILVVPADQDYWSPADRELILALDDILIEGGRVAPFSRTETTYAAMGRFGNVFLINGDPELRLTATAGEVVRLWLTNTASTRVFNVTLPGARMKLVGGDGGRVEHEEFIDGVVLGPSERAVVDVLIEQPGELTLEHHTPSATYRLASFAVGDGPETPSPAARDFPRLRTSPELKAERQQLDRWLAAPPDKTLAMIAQMNDPTAMPAGAGPMTYACPMHPEVISDEPGRCPKCGMKLLAIGPTEPTHSQPTGHTVHVGHSEAATGDGIEWEDHMIEINRLTTTANTYWRFLDRTNGVDNAVIDWEFSVGQRVKIRLINEMDSDHPMHHPFHLHGAGRFLVLTRDGAVEPNLVWKDTVLVRTGQTVDILFDVTNPGLWMAHCHIAEHMQSCMMFSFTVAR